MRHASSKTSLHFVDQVVRSLDEFADALAPLDGFAGIGLTLREL
jgi:hypothetical protein